MANFEIVSTHAQITVDKNGLSTSTTDYEMRALNEQGRQALVLQSHPFYPDVTKVDVLRASSVTDGVETPVNLKTLTTRPVAGTKYGITHAKEIVIPFSNIKVGSTIKYTLREKELKQLVKGLFTMEFTFGATVPELGGDATIKSAIPLNLATSDPWHVIDLKESKQGQLFVYEIKQTKSLFKVPAEKSAILRKDTISMIQISSMKEWKEFVNPIADRYEKILSDKQLPSVFESIVKKASFEKTLADKIDVVTSELASIMTYSGEWTSFDKMYFPKSLSTISKLKTGDCKDFALATTAMLRRLGISANVAMTIRKNGREGSGIKFDPALEPFPMQKFNHAIVKVKDNDKVLWVDPTNIVSNSAYIYSDIAGSSALEIVKNATFETIPYPAKKLSSIQSEKIVVVKEDNTGESTVKFDLSGEFSKAIAETALAENEDVGRKVLMSFTGVDPRTGTSYFDGISLKDRRSKSLKGTFNTTSERIAGDKDGKKYLLTPLPIVLRGLLELPGKRVTDVSVDVMYDVDSTIKFKGYDFVGLKSGCTILTPWFELRRSFFKNIDGFEVQDHVELKTNAISKNDINSDKFSMAVGDIEECAETQTVEVKKIEGQTLEARLAEYSLLKAQEKFDSPGPASISGSREALHIVDQMLLTKPKEKELLILKARSLRRVGYKSEMVDRSEYLDAADAILNVLNADYPNDPKILIQKTYSSYYRKDNARMAQDFQKAFSVSPKNYELYILGGTVAERMRNYRAALGSYSKAYTFAKTNHEKAAAEAEIGEALFFLNDTNNAILHYRNSIALEENAWAQGRLMDFYQHANRWDDAISLGEEILKKNPYGVAKKALSSIYAQKGQNLFQLALRNKISPNDKKMDDIESLLLTGLKHHSSCGDCLIGLAELYGYKAQKTDSREFAQKSLTYYERAFKDADVDPQRFAHNTNSLKSFLAGAPTNILNQGESRAPSNIPASPQ